MIPASSHSTDDSLLFKEKTESVTHENLQVSAISAPSLNTYELTCSLATDFSLSFMSFLLVSDNTTQTKYLGKCLTQVNVLNKFVFSSRLFSFLSYFFYKTGNKYLRINKNFRISFQTLFH